MLKLFWVKLVSEPALNSYTALSSQLTTDHFIVISILLYTSLLTAHAHSCLPVYITSEFFAFKNPS